MLDQIRIVAAAIRVGKGVFMMPPPARHHDLIRLLSEMGVYTHSLNDQGFIDSKGIFRERVQAKVIAMDAGQLLDRASDHPHLFSEDVW